MFNCSDLGDFLFEVDTYRNQFICTGIICTHANWGDTERGVNVVIINNMQMSIVAGKTIRYSPYAMGGLCRTSKETVFRIVNYILHGTRLSLVGIIVSCIPPMLHMLTPRRDYLFGFIRFWCINQGGTWLLLSVQSREEDVQTDRHAHRQAEAVKEE